MCALERVMFEFVANLGAYGTGLTTLVWVRLGSIGVMLVFDVY